MKLNGKRQVMDVCVFRCSDFGLMNTSEGKKMQLTDSFRKSLTLFAAVVVLCCLCVAQPVFAAKVLGWGTTAVNSDDLAKDGFVSIAAGRYHSLALQKDGSRYDILYMGILRGEWQQKTEKRK